MSSKTSEPRPAHASVRDQLRNAERTLHRIAEARADRRGFGWIVVAAWWISGTAVFVLVFNEHSQATLIAAFALLAGVVVIGPVAAIRRRRERQIGRELWCPSCGVRRRRPSGDRAAPRTCPACNSTADTWPLAAPAIRCGRGFQPWSDVEARDADIEQAAVAISELGGLPLARLARTALYVVAVLAGMNVILDRDTILGLPLPGVTQLGLVALIPGSLLVWLGTRAKASAATLLAERGCFACGHGLDPEALAAGGLVRCPECATLADARQYDPVTSIEPDARPDAKADDPAAASAASG